MKYVLNAENVLLKCLLYLDGETKMKSQKGKKLATKKTHKGA